MINVFKALAFSFFCFSLVVMFYVYMEGERVFLLLTFFLLLVGFLFFKKATIMETKALLKSINEK
jgi:hypothetical protein